MARAALVLRLHHGLNALAALLWVLFLIELSPARVSVADYGVPVLMLALFVLIPVGLVAILVLERRSEVGQRAYRLASKTFLALTWVPTWMPVLFLLAIIQPWPLTLREGPDTGFAREGFTRLYGAEPPEPVSGVHYRVEGPRDPIFYLRFTTTEREAVDHLVERLRLEREELPRELPEAGPPWFSPQDGAAPAASWSRREGWEALWYFPDSGLVLYRDVTF